MLNKIALLVCIGVLAGCGSGEKTDLGIAVYPGASKVPNADVRASIAGSGMELVTYKTKDEQSKVAEFYKSKYPDQKPTEMAFGRDAVMVLRIEDAKTKSGVIVHRKKGQTETTIEIASGKQDEK